MNDHLLIDVARLDAQGEHLEGALDASVLDLHDAWTHVQSGLRYALDVQLYGRELVVRGVLDQDFTAACSRCGVDFTFTVRVGDFTTSVQTDDKTQFVDLTDEVRQSVLLDLPAYPVCREDCQGVCPTCGKNLNEGTCSCRKVTQDSRWTALDAVQTKK